MKKLYESPMAEIIKYNTSDVVLVGTSDPVNVNNSETAFYLSKLHS